MSPGRSPDGARTVQGTMDGGVFPIPPYASPLPAKPLGVAPYQAQLHLAGSVPGGKPKFCQNELSGYYVKRLWKPRPCNG